MRIIPLLLSILFILLGCSESKTNSSDTSGSITKDSIAVDSSILTTSIDTTIYLCDNEQSIAVIYDNEFEYGDMGLTRSFVQLDSTTDFIEYRQVMSASGAKYENDEYVWWTKGNRAFLEQKSDSAILCHCEVKPINDEDE